MAITEIYSWTAKVFTPISGGCFFFLDALQHGIQIVF